MKLSGLSFFWEYAKKTASQIFVLVLDSKGLYFNPLSPNIHIQILQTDL